MKITPSDAQSQLSPPPRPVSPSVSRRAWSDPIARFCWLTCIVLVVIAGTFFIAGFSAWRHESRLINDGVPVDATIHAITDSTQSTITRDQASADPSSPVLLQFSWKMDPRYVTRHASPLENYTRLAVVGDVVRIRVDPQNPEDWTALSEPTPLRNRVMGAILTFPAVLAVFGAAILRQRGIIRLWKDGIATPSLIVSSSVSALSPLGRLARCTPAAEGDARVFIVYLPSRRTAPEPGEAIDLLAKPAPSQRAVAVEFFA
jgi:hypothetical protein